MIENDHNRVHVHKPVRSCTQTRMRARPHTLLTNRYMTPFDPPKISVARDSHFHVNSHISCKYINSLCIYFHLHSHFHMTLFALNDLNGSCFNGPRPLVPVFTQAFSLLQMAKPIRRNQKSASFKAVLLGTKSHCLLFHQLLHSSFHGDPCEQITFPKSATQHPIHDTAYSTVFMLKDQQKIIIAVIIIVIINIIIIII